jgi:hypothetical protein
MFDVYRNAVEEPCKWMESRNVSPVSKKIVLAAKNGGIAVNKVTVRELLEGKGTGAKGMAQRQ